MQNAANVLKIILYFIEFATKYKMSRNEAATSTAQKLGISISDVLAALAKQLTNKK